MKFGSYSPVIFSQISEEVIFCPMKYICGLFQNIQLRISHLVCRPRLCDPPGKMSLPLLWVSCSHSREVWKPQNSSFRTQNCNSSKNFTNDIIQNYVCAILVTGLYVRESTVNDKRNSFSFCILKPLSFSRSHLSDSIHSLTPADSSLASQSFVSSASCKGAALLASAREIMSCWIEVRFAEASDGLNQPLLSCWRTHQ